MLGLDNPVHILFLLILLLLVFGAKRLPEMGRSLGSGMRGFKDSLSGEHLQPSVTAGSPAQPTPAAAQPATQAPAPLASAAPAPAATPAPVAPAAREATPAGAPVGVSVGVPVGVSAEPVQDTGAPFAA